MLPGPLLGQMSLSKDEQQEDELLQPLRRRRTSMLATIKLLENSIPPPLWAIEWILDDSFVPKTDKLTSAGSPSSGLGAGHL